MTTSITAHEIASGLGLRRVGHGWRGPCPLHGGSSFTMADKDNKPVFTCWSGCERNAILAELRSRGLWPERTQREWTAEQRRDWARQRREDQHDVIDARCFGQVAMILAEQALAELSANAPERTCLTRLLAAVRNEISLLTEFREWRRSQPHMTAALVDAGREHQMRVQTMVAHFLMQGVVADAATT